MHPFFCFMSQPAAIFKRYILKGIAMIVFVGLVATAMVGNWVIRTISNS